MEHGIYPASPESSGDDDVLFRTFLGAHGGPPDQFFPGPTGQHSPFPSPSTPDRQSNLQWRRTGPNTMTLTGTIRPGTDNGPHMPSPAGLLGGLLGSFLTHGMGAGGQPPGMAGGGGSGNSFTYSSPNGRTTFSYRTIRSRDFNNPGTPGPPVDELYR